MIKGWAEDGGCEVGLQARLRTEYPMGHPSGLQLDLLVIDLLLGRTLRRLAGLLRGTGEQVGCVFPHC